MLLAQALITASFLASVGGTRSPIENPSFDISEPDAAVDLSQAAQHPVRLQRPLVILGGLFDVGVGPMAYEAKLRRCVRGKIIRIAFADCLSLAQCRKRVSDRLDAELGVANAKQTVEVDVIGQSLGGLIGAYSALDDPALGKRLNVNRLFTISSPLQGAKLATRVPWDVFSIQRDCRPGNAIAKRLATTPITYELYSYTRLRDPTVGALYAALPGHSLYWVDTPRFQSAHAGAFADPRLMLDIVRRLRGETPIAHDPPAPLPPGQASPTT